MVMHASARRQELLAYHEAGHTVAHALCASGEEGLLGASPAAAEDPERDVELQIRLQFFCLLAGGIAEQLHTGSTASSSDADGDMRLAMAFAGCLEGDGERAELFVRRTWVRTRRVLQSAAVWKQVEDQAAHILTAAQQARLEQRRAAAQERGRILSELHTAS